MLLNRVEYVLMNNPLQAALQRRFETCRLLALGGPMIGGLALEIGCGRGVGVEIILDRFGADRVDALDLDPRMLAQAKRRLQSRGDRVRLWLGSVTAIPVEDRCYDAVFDFGIIHHVPNWRDAVAEVYRVLRPGGRFYAEEVLTKLITHPLWRRLLRHPQRDRFDHETLHNALAQAGFAVTAAKPLGGLSAGT